MFHTRLRVWQSADKLCSAVYDLTKRFPTDERYALTSQLRRAAVSVPTNLAEGQAAFGTREGLRYAGIAAASLAEVANLLRRAYGCGHISSAQHQELYQLQSQTARLLYGLIRALRSAGSS
ncbi:MAG: four helix bundle protein [Gemmatimonadetes bacterium]|nr:four helix bundle protein [Gemmatimonadota bacterium]